MGEEIRTLLAKKTDNKTLSPKGSWWGGEEEEEVRDKTLKFNEEEKKM